MPLPTLFPPPAWTQSRVPIELAKLLRSPTFRDADEDDAEGQPVLLIPGFLAGDGSLALMTSWLRRSGHRTIGSGMRFNVDCSGAAMDRLEGRLARFAEASGRRVAVIGQSRGGLFGRALAVRRPDLVSGIVCLGSPVVNPLAVNVFAKLGILTVGVLGALGAPGCFRHTCRDGACCNDFWDAVAGPYPENVGYLSVYSRSDGVVDHRACLDPAAQWEEIDSTHVGMSVNSDAYRLTASALDELRHAEHALAPAFCEAA